MIDCYCLYFFFFFKQKTAYEMRISDWSSDVCSSDVTTFRTRMLPWHLGRAVLNSGAMMCWFTSLSLLPVGEATAVSLIGPVFIALLAMVFLGERVGPRRWLGIDRKSTRLNSSH